MTQKVYFCVSYIRMNPSLNQTKHIHPFYCSFFFHFSHLQMTQKVYFCVFYIRMNPSLNQTKHIHVISFVSFGDCDSSESECAYKYSSDSSDSSDSFEYRRQQIKTSVKTEANINNKKYFSCFFFSFVSLLL
jgi:hypothetical protein